MWVGRAEYSSTLLISKFFTANMDIYRLREYQLRFFSLNFLHILPRLPGWPLNSA
jgi:hypothetical protein